jgi:hypothetical protein
MLVGRDNARMGATSAHRNRTIDAHRGFAALD